MKTSIIKFLFAGLFFSAAITGCSKTDTVNDLNNNPQQLSATTNARMADSFGGADDGTTPESGMLNRNLSIAYASDGKMNVSEQFTGYTFKFTGTQPRGEAVVTTSQGAQTGSWSWREGSDMFALDFQNTTLEQAAYLSRVWTMRPSTSPGVMNLVAPDGDVLQMTTAK